MKIFGFIILYLLIGIIDFFCFFCFVCIKDELHKSDSFKEGIKQALIETCKELQTLDLSDPSDIIMTVMITIIWPLILVCGIVIIPCTLCVYGIKRIAGAILNRLTKSETKDTINGKMTPAEKKEFEKAVKSYKEYKKTHSPKPPKNTRSVRDQDYDPGEVTLKTSKVDNPSRKRVKKIKKVNIE